MNVLGTLAVFEAVKAAGDQVKRLVYASSAAVFGGPDKYPAGAQPDDVPLIPSTHYGVFKCCNEGNARIYFQDFGISSVGLRPWTVYGVGRDLGMTSEPTKAIKAALLGRPYHINFGGWSDFQYVDDVAKTFVNSLDRPYSGAKSYNLRGAVIAMKEFHAALSTVLPDAAKLVTFGTTQIAIAYDLSDDGLAARPRPDAEDVARRRHPRNGGHLQATPERRPARHGGPRSAEGRAGGGRERAVIVCRRTGLWPVPSSVEIAAGQARGLSYDSRLSHLHAPL